jgi:hypothetical protein
VALMVSLQPKADNTCWTIETSVQIVHEV